MRIAIAALTLLAAAAPAAADPAYTIFDVPHASNTRAQAVNAAGVVAGIYLTKHGKCRQICGFVRHPDGSFTTFRVHDAPFDVTGIDDQDTVAGSFSDGDGTHGFLRSADGIVTKIDLRGNSTGINAINAHGVVTGSFDPKDFLKGFVRKPNGRRRTFKAGPRGDDTRPSGINATEVVAGSVTADSKPSHAFIRAADGTLTLFDAPNAGSSGTTGAAIDDAGDIAGQFLDTASDWHGYLRDADGTAHVFQVPGVQEFGTIQVACIATVDTDRQVIGYAQGDPQRPFGFVRHDDGTFETFDLSHGSVEFAGTFVTSCTQTGLSAGFYTDDLKTSHAFLRTP